MDQLPDFFIAQCGLMGRHGGIFRSMLDDPEQLSIGNLLHRFGAGEIPRRRIKFRGKTAVAVSTPAMTLATGGGFGVFTV